MRLSRLGALGALAATAHTALNLRLLRVPPAAAPVTERVSVLLPLRDEADRAPACLRALLAARAVPDLEILILDDDSHDTTAAVVEQLAGADPRVRLVRGGPPPPGWLGKPHACARLAGLATGSVLVFLDADVELAPDGLARAVAALSGPGGPVELVSPYPRQLAEGWGPRLVQPLLAWSWLTFLPLRLAQRSARPSLSAAGGQLLVVRAGAYRAAGGHHAIRDQVLDDLALARAVKRTGGRVTLADGTALADCRMYRCWPEVRDGYTKSLWAAFEPPPQAAAVLTFLGLLYLAPWVELVRRRTPLAAAGVCAGVAGRAAVARRVGARVWPDSLAHPVSVLLVGYLTVRSHVGHRRGTLRWRDRPV
jgi:glycosyltransferase involved in cell wall biosynthesis